MKHQRYMRKCINVLLQIAAFALILPVVMQSTPASAATCDATHPAAPPTTFGQVTQSVTVATAGTYRVWSRIKASSAANNSYYLQIDSGCSINVGDSTAIPAGSWTWVNYKDGSAASFVDVTLTAGSHNLAYTGREADVQLDRVLLLGDQSCTPTGTGDNCANVDNVNPTVSITAPAANYTVKQGTALGITATARDNIGVVKVEYLVDGAIVGTVPGVAGTTSYTYSWSTANATVGTHNLIARAYDAAGNSTPSAVVTGSVTAPSPGTDTIAPVVTSFTVNPTSALAGTNVVISAAATDNVGVTKVEFSVDGTIIATDTTAPYSTPWVPGVAGLHSVLATAYDAAGNSTPSTSINFTVTTTAPLPGDANNDHKVNASDYVIFQSHFNQNFPAADFDKSGTVDTADLAILLSHWTLF
jgi:hypothetical protein